MTTLVCSCIETAHMLTHLNFGVKLSIVKVSGYVLQKLTFPPNQTLVYHLSLDKALCSDCEKVSSQGPRSGL